MTRILFSFFVLLSANAVFGQQLNQKDAQGRRQGKWQKLYPKMTVPEYEGQFKDDKPVGTFTYYYQDKNVKATIVHDEKTGRSSAIMYHENGRVMATGIYRDQKKDSIWNYYGPSGRLSKSETYTADKLNGKSTVYYVPEESMNKSQVVAQVLNYKMGVLDGEALEYFDTGALKSKGSYVNGKRVGIWTTNHPNGNKMLLERYKNGMQHGWQQAFDEKGAEIGKKYFYYGKRLDGKQLDEKLKQLKAKGIDPNG